jgi:tight adherence protein C
MSATNDTMPILFSILAFVVLCLVWFNILQYLRKRMERSALKKRVSDVTEALTVTNEDQSSDNASARARASVVSFLNKLGSRFFKGNGERYSRTREKLTKAGVRQASAPAVLWGTKILLAGIFVVCYLVARLAVLKIFNLPAAVAVGVLTGALGFSLPDIFLDVKRARRKDRIVKALPDALDLMVVCLEAGMGLDSAFNRVEADLRIAHPVLSDELKLLSLELRAGKSRQEALRNLAARTDVEDLNNLVLVMIQSERFGTSVAQTLRVYSDSFRTKRHQRAEELAAKMPVKLVFPLVLFIFPSLFVVLIGPAAIRILKMFFR